MSGAARRHGQARGQRDDTSEGSRRRGGRGRSQGRGAPQLDGLGSWGTGYAPGSQGPPASNASFGVASQTQGGFDSQGNAGSQRSSISQNPTQPGPQSQPLNTVAGWDPAREKPESKINDMRNIDFPASFYNLDYELNTKFTRRPAFNSTGKPFNLPVNSYRVNQLPQGIIFQYDVAIGNGREKRMVIRKVWDSKARKNLTGPPCIFDGNKLAWSAVDYGPEARCMVDLDVEKGKPPRAGGQNAFRLQLRRSRQVDISIIGQYLSGRIQSSTEVAEAVSFLDHLLREGPSTSSNMVAVKRSFFVRGGQRADLGGGIEVFRGIYQSLRLAEGQKIVINLDSSNTAFYKPGALLDLIIQKNKFRDMSHLRYSFRDIHSAMATFKYLNKLTVKSQYEGNKLPNKEWKIKGMSPETANTYRINWKDPQTGKETGEKMTLTAYFKRRYNILLQHPDLPLLVMTKKDVMFPMELLVVTENQRYGSKLDEMQTAAMIKFAVSSPSERAKRVEGGKNALNWANDMYLKNYGLRIDDQQIVTQARVLPAPGVKFGRNKVDQPGTKGHWDLRGKQFLSGNPQELVSWGVGFFDGRTRFDKYGLEKFALDFAKAYRGHGGQVANGLPHLMKLSNDAGKAVEELFQGTGNQFKRKPQLLIFLVQNRDSMRYLRIKKSCDCRFGVVSQVMQAQQVQKGQPQYYSNVLMKINAKLGGCTSASVPAPASGFKSFGEPTMIIGADVSHASPGSDQASMAAVTVSFDQHAGRYVAACQTNGFRVEMIDERNMRSMLGPLASEWTTNVGQGSLPRQIYYIRDGVSEGEFAQVLHKEVPAIKAVMNRISDGSGWNGKVTVIVASKKHHIRAFPRQGDGDKEGNPLPGTLIEHDVTMPNEWDFYLYSHIALKGTSRPVHYTVIADEANHRPNVLQNMIYEHCYQYMRSTTSVSLHPAVYYAHLASKRAKAHEDISDAALLQGRAGIRVTQQTGPDGPDGPAARSAAPLLPLNEENGLQFSTWYI